MMSRLRLLRQCIVIFVLLFPVQVCAGIYVYVDMRGVKHYTNTPTSKRYRPATLPRLNTPRSDGYYADSGPARKASSLPYDPFRYDRQIERAAKKYMLDPLLIKAIIKAESDFDQYATSSKGAQGLMQLMPATADDLQVWNPYDASENINGGARYFKKLLNEYNGDVVRSLAAYNAGPGRVHKDGPLPRIKETRNYVQKVTRYYQQYRKLNPVSRSKPDKLVTLN